MQRRLDAALLLDKPAGLSSNAALQAAKRLFRAGKAGHGGTLDPLASGLLPVFFGEATKFAAMMLEAEKEYRATLKLGETTTTGDAEGAALESRPVEIDERDIEAALQRFRGAIEQQPPMHSALKHAGTPLYRLARQGKTVDRPRRRVQILELELTQRRGELLELRVRCSKGTYVRTLAEDLGAALGTGAHLAALRRTAVGRLAVGRAVGLEALERMTEAERDRQLLPLERLLEDLPRAELDHAAEARFRNGQSVLLGGLGAGLVGVYRPDGALIGLGQAAPGGGLRPRRLTSAIRVK